MITFDEYKQLQTEIQQLTERKTQVTSRSAKLLITKRIKSLNKLISAKIHSNVVV
jgi:hypothetical protein